MKWFDASDGGLYILLPRSVRQAWHGVLGDGADYARACEAKNWLDKLVVNGQDVLVLGYEAAPVAVVPHPDGPWLVRWLAAVDEPTLLRDVQVLDLQVLPPLEQMWVRVADEVHVLIDSADPGDRPLDEMPVQLPLGNVRVDTFQHTTSEVDCIVHRFVPVDG